MNEEFRVYYSARIYSEMLRAMARRTVDIRSKLRFANRELGRIATELRYFKNEKETLRLIYADNKNCAWSLMHY